MVGLGTANAYSQEAVVNGGFETSTPDVGPSGFPPGWMSSDTTPTNSGVGNDSAFANSGAQYAFLGTDFGQTTTDSLSQVLNTVAGGSYTLSFFLANDSGVTPNSFQALFNGFSVFLVTNSPAFGYTNIVIAGLTATTSTTTLEFRYLHDDDFFRLDDVSVQGPAPGGAAVPEIGATAVFALPAFVGLCLVHFFQARRRRLA